MNIGNAMKRKGLGTGELADLSGVEAKNLSAYKCGSRRMGRKAAEKLSGALETSPEALLVGNRAAVLENAVKRGDRHGVLNACKSMLAVAEDAGADAQTLDQIVDIGTRFAAVTKASAPGFADDEENLSFDDRDGLGRKVVSKSFPRSATPEESAAYRAEDEDVDDEGRDSRGIRVRPMEGVYP